MHLDSHCKGGGGGVKHKFVGTAAVVCVSVTTILFHRGKSKNRALSS